MSIGKIHWLVHSVPFANDIWHMTSLTDLQSEENLPIERPEANCTSFEYIPRTTQPVIRDP